MFKKASICLGALVMVTMVIGLLAFWSTSPPSGGKDTEIKLSRGTFTVLDFPSKRTHASAIILFASGDGGWGSLEEAICHAFQNQGYEVIGIDSAAYAQTDYDLDVLQLDFSKIARTAQAPFGVHPPPLIVGGYSMGAAQAVAVAGGPHQPKGLVGLLLIDPCSRGRYGLRPSDHMDIIPTGPGTFDVAAFSNTIGSLRVVQWHAGEDSIDSSAWLDSLTAQHKIFTFPDAGHDYDTHRDNFIRQLVKSAGWILSPAPDGAVTAKTKMDQ
jgi:pimeloyl-ACP methyl ester carboxylesterase